MSADEILNSIKNIPLLKPNLIVKVAVLYSHEQKCFHIESLLEYIIENFALSTTGAKGDYRLLGITDSEEDAHDLIEEIKSYFTFLNFKY